MANNMWLERAADMAAQRCRSKEKCGAYHMDIFCELRSQYDCDHIYPYHWLQKIREERPDIQNNVGGVVCKLIDQNGREVCHSLTVRPAMDANTGNLNEVDGLCIKVLAEKFRSILAAKSPEFANRTIDQIKDVINAMIFMGVYQLEWFYFGWIEKKWEAPNGK